MKSNLVQLDNNSIVITEALKMREAIENTPQEEDNNIKKCGKD